MRGIKKMLAFTLVLTMLLSSASCAVFGKNKEVLEAADEYASALVSMNTRKILKLTTEKKDSDAAYTLSSILDNERRSDEMNKFVKAVSSTITYEVDSSSLEVKDEKASVDVIFTMVDYEKVLKKGDFESVDDVLSALEDCDDTEDVKINVEFKYKKDEWLVSNLKDKEYLELYAFCSCNLGIMPDIDEIYDYSYISAGSNYINLYLYFIDDVSSYENLFTYDVFYGNTCLKSDAQAQIYGDFLLCDYYDPNYSDLGPGEYTVNVYYNGEDVTTECIEIAGLAPVEDDFDYAGYEMLVENWTIGYGSEEINLWSYSQDIPDYVEEYCRLNPDFESEYTVNVTVIRSDTTAYNQALDKALETGVSQAPDLFVTDLEYCYKYSKGVMSDYVLTYEDLGIDCDEKIAQADIAQFIVDLGSNRYGDVVGLGVEAFGGALIYRRSIADDVFGTDDPAQIQELLGGGSGNWDKFCDAAQVCKDNGVAIVVGMEDLWKAYECSRGAWIDDGMLNTDSGKYDFFDFYDTFIGNGWTDDADQWTDAWMADLQGSGDMPVFCFFGPSWLLNYTMTANCGGDHLGEGTYGDWAVCLPPEGFYWGGSLIYANKNTEHADAVAELIEWMTLDTSDTGLQYILATGSLSDTYLKTTVASLAVLSECENSSDFAGGQNINEVYIEAARLASAENVSEYDSQIDYYFLEAVDKYVHDFQDYYHDLEGAIGYFEGELNSELYI